MTAMNQVERGSDGRYSAYGIVNGRPFVADAETLEEVQNERQELKHKLIEREELT